MTVDESLAALRRKGGDRLAMNFYRTGTLAATTYETDPLLFRVMWQLGQLSVRMNADRVTAAAF